MKQFWATFVHQYFMIYTLTMFGTFIYCLFINREADFDYMYMGKVALFSLAADLPLLVYISKTPLDGKRLLIREIIHAVLLFSILPIGGRLCGMYDGILGGVLFFVIAVFIYFAVRFITYETDVKTANSINELLSERNNDDE